jgi:tRNA A37 threonylcarbamoyladenosine biosynthesis protein TsaE
VVRPEAWEGVAGIIGRESELKVLGEFVAAAAGGGALVLKGGPGVGKTTLWRRGGMRRWILGCAVRVRE